MNDVTALFEGPKVEKTIFNNLVQFDKLRKLLVAMKPGLDKNRLSRQIREQYRQKRR
jgi:hypothetical protein